jgi:hypothetical protein
VEGITRSSLQLWREQRRWGGTPDAAIMKIDDGIVFVDVIDVMIDTDAAFTLSRLQLLQNVVLYVDKNI